MTSNTSPVALITGGSAGLGIVIAAAFIADGYQVVIVGRDQAKLDLAVEQLGDRATGFTADLTSPTDVSRLMESVKIKCGRLDVLVNCVGASDRGLVADLTSETLIHLVNQNVTTSLLCSQAALAMLEESQGVIVNIGSLAAKVGARYIGGYAAAKHALAGMSQQMRLELKPKGVHVGLVNPGPIRRDDEGGRYEQKTDGLPEQASKPGAGTRVKGLPPEKVAAAVLKCVKKRKPDIVLPGYLRILIAVGHASPRLGDWLLLKFTSGS